MQRRPSACTAPIFPHQCSSLPCCDEASLGHHGLFLCFVFCDFHFFPRAQKLGAFHKIFIQSQARALPGSWGVCQKRMEQASAPQLRLTDLVPQALAAGLPLASIPPPSEEGRPSGNPEIVPTPELAAAVTELLNNSDLSYLCARAQPAGLGIFLKNSSSDCSALQVSRGTGHARAAGPGGPGCCDRCGTTWHLRCRRCVLSTRRGGQ